jgi:hypothetical protein
MRVAFGRWKMMTARADSVRWNGALITSRAESAWAQWAVAIFGEALGVERGGKHAGENGRMKRRVQNAIHGK